MNEVPEVLGYIWPDGDFQVIDDDVSPHSWKSDDYMLVDINTTADEVYKYLGGNIENTIGIFNEFIHTE